MYTYPQEFFSLLRANRKEAVDIAAKRRIMHSLSDMTDGLDETTMLLVERFADELTYSGVVKAETDDVYDINQLVAVMTQLKPDVLQSRPGLYVVIGQTATGKTRWVRSLVENENIKDSVVFLSHDEPKLASDEFGTSSGMHELIACFEDFVTLTDVNTIVLDSVRTIQYESRGNTLSGGVNSGFFRFLTDIGNAAVDAGVTMIVTYNPNTEKDETYHLVSAMVDGAVQGIIDLNKNVIRSRYDDRSDKPSDRAYDVIFGDTFKSSTDDSMNNNFNLEL